MSSTQQQRMNKAAQPIEQRDRSRSSEAKQATRARAAARRAKYATRQA